MNRNPIEQFLEKAKNVGLSDERKSAIEAKLLAFMQQHPVQPAKRWWFGFNPMQMFQLRPANIALASIILLFAVGGVASVQADSSLPGDLLYPIKLGFNEKVKEAAAFSTQARADLQIMFAKERLQEAEKLTVQGRLTAANEARLDSDFKTHAAAIVKDIKKLRDENLDDAAQKVATDFEASLRAHQRVMGSLETPKTGRSLGAIKDTVSQLLNPDNEDGTNANDAAQPPKSKTDDESSIREKSIKKKLNSLEASAAKIKKLIKNKKHLIGEDGVLQSKGNLDLLQKKIDDAKAKVSNDINGHQALNDSLQEASLIAKQTKDLIDAKSNLGAASNVSIGIQEDADDKDFDVSTDATVDTETTIKAKGLVK